MGGIHASWKVDEGGAGNEKDQLSILDRTMGESRIRGRFISLVYVPLQPSFRFHIEVPDIWQSQWWKTPPRAYLDFLVFISSQDSGPKYCERVWGVVTKFVVISTH